MKVKRCKNTVNWLNYRIIKVKYIKKKFLTTTNDSYKSVKKEKS